MAPQRTTERATSPRNQKKSAFPDAKVSDSTADTMGPGEPRRFPKHAPDLRLAIDADQPPARLAFIGRRTVWVYSEVPDMEGFGFLSRTDITNAEQAALRERHDYYAGEYQEQWRAAEGAEKDAMTTPLTFQKQMLAPYILNWNAVGLDPETGEPVRLEPPATAGISVFEHIPTTWYDWLAYMVLGGYLATGKVRTSAPRYAITGSGSGTTPSPDQESPSPPADGPSPEPLPEPLPSTS